MGGSTDRARALLFVSRERVKRGEMKLLNTEERKERARERKVDCF